MYLPADSVGFFLIYGKLVERCYELFIFFFCGLRCHGQLPQFVIDVYCYVRFLRVVLNGRRPDGSDISDAVFDDRPGRLVFASELLRKRLYCLWLTLQRGRPRSRDV
jgi:hypothetical protein